jgi:hypothetical protein
VLDQLLGPAVQKADMRVDALDDLTVELQYQAQDAVSRRMLGPEIEGEVAQGGFGHNGLASAAGSTLAADGGSSSIGFQFHLVADSRGRISCGPLGLLGTAEADPVRSKPASAVGPDDRARA